VNLALFHASPRVNNPLCKTKLWIRAEQRDTSTWRLISNHRKQILIRDRFVCSINFTVFNSPKYSLSLIEIPHDFLQYQLSNSQTGPETGPRPVHGIFSTALSINCTKIRSHIITASRSQWPCGLRRGSAAARLLGLWVRIPPWARRSVCCDCCVL
jgi:hypothetical protein